MKSMETLQKRKNYDHKDSILLLVRYTVKCPLITQSHGVYGTYLSYL